MDKVEKYVDEQLSSIFSKHSLVLRPKEELRKIIDTRIAEIEAKNSVKSETKTEVKKKKKKVE